MKEEVWFLERVRDKYLLTNQLERALKIRENMSRC